MKPCDIDDLLAKVREAEERRSRMEEKIRMAQSRMYVKSPRDILRDTEGGDA